MGFSARGDDGKPMNQQLLSDTAAPPYLRRAVAEHARGKQTISTSSVAQVNE
jgi:hypothetical protein